MQNFLLKRMLSEGLWVYMFKYHILLTNCNIIIYTVSVIIKMLCIIYIFKMVLVGYAKVYNLSYKEMICEMFPPRH